jgi:hypothetical protein
MWHLDAAQVVEITEAVVVLADAARNMPFLPARRRFKSRLL